MSINTFKKKLRCAALDVLYSLAFGVTYVVGKTSSKDLVCGQTEGFIFQGLCLKVFLISFKLA